MKIEKLTDNKIKITLSVDDLEERNINLHSFMYNSPESQDMFWDLLKTAEKEYGFCIEDSFIYVEAATTGSGNFTLLVTKADDKDEQFKSPKTKKISNDNIKLKRKIPTIQSKDCIYVFEQFDDILDFVKTCDTFILNDNSLYKMDNNYYLKIDEIPYNTVLDYATPIKSSDVLDGKLNEYGNIVLEHEALQTLSLYFNKTKKRKKSSK